MLGFEPKTSPVLGKGTTTEPHLQPLSLLFETLHYTFHFELLTGKLCHHKHSLLGIIVQKFGVARMARDHSRPRPILSKETKMYIITEKRLMALSSLYDSNHIVLDKTKEIKRRTETYYSLLATFSSLSFLENFLLIFYFTCHSFSY